MVQNTGNNTGSCILYAVVLAVILPLAYKEGGWLAALVAFLIVGAVWSKFMPTDT
jgi:hypothetical protein